MISEDRYDMRIRRLDYFVPKARSVETNMVHINHGSKRLVLLGESSLLCSLFF